MDNFIIYILNSDYNSSNVPFKIFVNLGLRVLKYIYNYLNYIFCKNH